MRERSVASVREAFAGDAGRLRSLLRQLGYEVSEAHVADVLSSRDADHEVFVAVISGAGVVGMVETAIARPTLAGDTRSELTALVVEDEFRSCGIGAALLARAENWTRERGCVRLRVRSNVVRERAHAFYERLAYRRVKAQNIYEKTL